MQTTTHTPEIKTIDITAKEWLDRVNGNTYFSAQITLNFGLPDSQTIKVPFQYGYENQYENVAFNQLESQLIITDSEDMEQFWQYCKRKNIILKTNKYKNCKKRDVMQYGQN